MTDQPKLNAAALLDKACTAEKEGKAKIAETAFRIALKRDEEEHAADPATVSLPRK